MTTPTWEPVGQAILDAIVNDPLYMRNLTEDKWRNIAQELLASRALLVEWDEAEGVISVQDADIRRLRSAEDAIRAHVQRIVIPPERKTEECKES